MKDDTVFLRHMLEEEVDFILKETNDVAYENLVKDEVLKRALLRSLEVIGEATKNLSQDFREEHPEVTWKELAGLRDKLIARPRDLVGLRPEDSPYGVQQLYCCLG